MHHNHESIIYVAKNNINNNLIHMCQAIDRDYNFLHTVLHSIGTHQIHHISAKIPHYKLARATYYFRINYHTLIKSSNKNILSEFIKITNKRYNNNNYKSNKKYNIYSSYDKNNNIHK
jgi:acyl-lipid omega-3 desaturase